MLDDRKAETRPPDLASSALVDPEEALRQARDKLRIDAFTGIGDDQVGSVSVGTPGHDDLAVSRSKPNSIREQIDDHGLDFGGAPLEVRGRLFAHHNPRNIPMPVERLPGFLQQATNIDLLFDLDLLGTFQTR